MTRSKSTEVERHHVDPDHDVVALEGGNAGYRRKVCPGCPWRRSNTGTFPAGAFEVSADTAHDQGQAMFACHEVGAEHPVTCAGFLLRGAEHNMTVRFKIIQGEIDLDSLDTSEEDDLHAGYTSMAMANGVPRSALRNVRLSSWEEEETN